MDRVRQYIIEQVAAKKLNQKDAEEMLMELLSKQDRGEHDIAIIGMSGKYADSSNLDEYWDILANRKGCIRSYDPARIKDEENLLDIPYYGEILTGHPITRENVYYSKSGYFKDGIDKFDAGFFGISPREAKFIEPAHRLFLETAWEAIEDAGYGGDKIYGTNTGVFVGRDTTVLTLYKHMTVNDPMHLTGSWSGILASRLSYIYNLQGPSLIIDTACSSGLVSVHEACQALRNKTCDMAIAAGVHITYSAGMPKGEKTIMDLGSVESHDDTPRPFDKKANGTLWGEGIGTVFLKPLGKALKDGDNIYAVIKGSAINNDGASNGITAPSATAQEKVLLSAWKDAGINPETLFYIEAHGTATNLGDPIEVKGLTNAFRHFTDKKQFCGVGSTKGNIGHTVAASGLAALMKVILSLRHDVIPPTLNFDEPNQYIDFNNSPIYVNDRMKKWPKGASPRRAGVSSFGFSGTNCHVVIEEAPEVMRGQEPEDGIPLVLMLSGRNESVLKDLVYRYVKFIEKGEKINLKDICYTANTGRGQYSSRLALIVKDYEDFKSKIYKVWENGFEKLSEKDIYYGSHWVVVDNKQVKDAGEIGESEKRKITKLANEKLDELLKSKENSYEKMDEICRLFAKGADVKWDKLYEGQNRRRVSIPVYPLERTRFWAEPRVTMVKGYEMKDKKEYKHPLLDRKVADTQDTFIFSTKFSVDTHWVLKEHIFMNNHVMPGIAYIEIGREACSKVYEDCKLEIRNIVFPAPLVIEKDEVKEVQTVVKKMSDHLEFTISSKMNPTGFEGDEIWVLHAEGKAYKLDASEQKTVDIQPIMERCSHAVPPDDDEIEIPGRKYVDKPFTFGIRWQNISTKRYGIDEDLVEIKLDDSCHKDLDEFFMHPSQLDNGMNAMMTQLKYDVYLPFSYKSLKMYYPLTGKFYTHIRKLDKMNSGAETLSFNISLIDESGRVLAEAEHYTIKKVHEGDRKHFRNVMGSRNAYYKTTWVPKEAENSAKDAGNGCFVAFGNETELCQRILADIKRVNGDMVEVYQGKAFSKLEDNKYMLGGSGQDYEKLVHELKDRKISKIVHMFTVGADNAVENVEQLKESQEKGVMSLFHLTKALVANKIKENIDIVLISDYASSVTGDEPVIKPHNAALFGLGKIIHEEYANLSCRSIDIDSSTEVYNLIRELTVNTESVRCAYRNGKRYVEEFKREIVSGMDEHKIEIKEDGVYVITGGTGGLGLEISKYLAGENKVNLALINRSKLPDMGEWDKILENGENIKLCQKIENLKEIEAKGAKIQCISADITNKAEVEKIFADLREKYGKINGIVHCAGVAGVGYIMNKDESVFKDVIAPKVQGTWVLDKVSENDNMDFFVLFSSMATLQNMAGQGDYTAANSYLNSFAEYRSKQGKRTVAIKWPSWKETGMAVDYNAAGDEADEMVMFKAITTAKAIEAFDTVLNSDLTNAAPGDLNYAVLDRFPEQFSFVLSDQIKKAIEKAVSGANGAKGTGAGKGEAKEVILKGKGEGDYNETEYILAQIFAGVLGLDKIDIYVSIHEMGGDSILATQLVKEIDKVFPGVIDITDIFTHSSVEQMARYINEKRGVSFEAEEKTVNGKEDASDKELKDLFDSMVDEAAVTKGE